MMTVNSRENYYCCVCVCLCVWLSVQLYRRLSGTGAQDTRERNYCLRTWWICSQVINYSTPANMNDICLPSFMSQRPASLWCYWQTDANYFLLYSGSLRAIYSVKQCLHLCVCTRVELRRRRRKNVVAVTLSEGFLVVLWSDNYISYTLYNG